MNPDAKLSQPELWVRIESHVLPFRPLLDRGVNPPRVCAAFADELRMAGDWTDESAARLVIEYRRYLYLARVAGENLAAPPVLEAMFLQLLGLGDMFSLLVAPRIPRGLAATSGLKKTERLPLYRATLQLYEREFGERPPEDIWISEHAFVYDDLWGWVGLTAMVCIVVSMAVPMVVGGLFAALGATLSGSLGQFAREVVAGDRFGNINVYLGAIIFTSFVVAAFSILMIAEGPKRMSDS